MTIRSTATVPAPAAIRPNADKISEAAELVQRARVCLLQWVREHYLATENVTEYVDHVEDVLDRAKSCQQLATALTMKGLVLSGRNPFSPEESAKRR